MKERHDPSVVPAEESAVQDLTLCSVDCADDQDPDAYFESARTRVINTSIGSYREAATTKEARFGFRFSIRHPGIPHEAIIRFPDDKARFMCIMDGSTYDLSTGVFNGGAIPISGEMRELRLTFWPRWKTCTLVFMTWKDGEPAAVASFEVRELEGLPPAPVSDLHPDCREFGIAFEDPCGVGLSLGATTRAEWIERVSRFMRHTGQSLLIYPIAWYHGPLFPSDREPADTMDMAMAPDRRMYGRYTIKPSDWVALLLETFADQNLGFLAEVRFFRLGSLMRKMNIDLDSIIAGADTINNMLWNNQVQCGTMDWTVVYNARNYPEMVERRLGVHVDNFRGFPFAYGEKCWADVGSDSPSNVVPPGPIFNPLHPTVKEAVLGFVREIAQRYGRHRSFRGIAVGLWVQTSLWFGSLRRGYDDLSVGLFQEESGICVPVPGDAPDRFSRRYAFLTTHCRDEWIAWRCRQVRDLLLAVRDVLKETRHDLSLVLVPNVGSIAWAEGAQHRPKDELLREAGFDLGLFSNETGIEIDIVCEGAAGLRELAALDGINDFKGTSLTGASIADNWVESWGKNSMFPCDADDSNAEAIKMSGGEPSGVYRFTCEYPPDGFWYDDQWRISTPFPAGHHYMAPIASALAATDALRLTRGGLYLDTAHAVEQRRFALAFGALPRVKFETLAGVSGPAVVRSAVHSGRRYIYAVNPTSETVSATVDLDGSSHEAKDLRSGELIRLNGSWTISLAGYQLRSFIVSS